MILSGGQLAGFPPAAMAETTPNLAEGYFYANATIGLSHRWASYGQIYREQVWVHAIIKKLARAQARLGIQVWDGMGPSKKIVDASPYLGLLRSPNPMMSGFKMWEWTRSVREIYGEAFWRKMRNADGKVIGLWPMHPSRISMKRDPTGEITYLFDAGAGPFAHLLALADTEVVPFLDFNPDNIMRGMSQLEPLRSTLYNEDSARRANSAFWDNGMRPSYVLSTDKAMSDDAIERLRNRVTGMHAGVDNFGKVGIFEEGLKPIPIVLNAEEMQYIGARQLNREECCGVMDIPPPVIHILDHATFSNITEQMRSMYRDTMAPRLEDDEDVLAKYLAPEFGGVEAARFPVDEVLRGDFETKATATASLVDHGIMKPKEARAYFDLPDAGPTADKLYGNANLVPLGETIRNPLADEAAGLPVPKPPGQAPSSPEPKSVPAPPAKGASPELRALMGQLGDLKGAKQKRQRLVDAHAKAIRGVIGLQRDEFGTVKASTGFDPRAWDAKLADAIGVPGDAAARYAGTSTARGLGGAFSLDTVSGWLAKQREETAKAFNDATASELDDANLDEDPDAVDHAFDVAEGDRADTLAEGLVTAVLGFVAHDTAERSGATTKTWEAGENARPSHADIDGETVAISDTFSNGLRWPGDGSTGDADEVAGCNCEMSFGTEA